jgi:hypothetical protein
MLLNSPHRTIKALISILNLLVLFSVYSCKKTDTLVNVEKNQVQLLPETPDNFFKLPSNASSVLKRIALELERQNKTKEFISAFIAKEGFPIWAKSRIERHKQKDNTSNFDADGLEDTTVYVPLVVSADEYVTGFLKATVNDSVDIKIYRQNDYSNFPFKTPTSSASVTTAEEYAVRMMTMDRDVFGNTTFGLNDKRMFNNSNDYSDTGNIIQRFVTLSDSTSGGGGEGGEGFADGSTINNYQYEVCWSVTVVYLNCPQQFGGGGTNNTTSCPRGYLELSMCTTYTIEVPGGGGGGGNGGNGGGGGTWPFPPGGGGGGGAPCSEEFGKSIKNSFMPIECNPSGGNPWPSRDPYGYLFSRILELRNKLALNPFAVTPCDSLNIMPLDPFSGFGTMYQRVAQSVPTQYVKDRIDSIASISYNWDSPDAFYSTNFDNAYGSILNCDFFPVRITQIPTGYTPESLLEYFRKNINQFIDPNLGISFDAYNDNHGFYDTARYYASGENSLGALIHIGMISDGSVILSNYYSNNTSQKHRFTFSTMKTPIDYDHPVAGNREFGIYPSQDQQHPNDFVFYTMGVDRISDWLFASGAWLHDVITQSPPFGAADDLWTSVQQKMVNFINNSPGGQAYLYTTPSIKARPKYSSDLKDYLLGTIDWTELKTRLGC